MFTKNVSTACVAKEVGTDVIASLMQDAFADFIQSITQKVTTFCAS